LAAGDPADASVTRGVQYLLDRQQPDGSWEEAPFTGTGFPRVFYLKYHLYQNSFPLYALARYRNVMYGESCREIVSGRDLAAAAVRAHNGNGRLG
jgi:squalene-hopene/tetraprenyl-beta-curcumene cyclase